MISGPENKMSSRLHRNGRVRIGGGGGGICGTRIRSHEDAIEIALMKRKYRRVRIWGPVVAEPQRNGSVRELFNFQCRELGSFLFGILSGCLVHFRRQTLGLRAHCDERWYANIRMKIAKGREITKIAWFSLQVLYS